MTMAYSAMKRDIRLLGMFSSGTIIHSNVYALNVLSKAKLFHVRQAQREVFRITAITRTPHGPVESI